MWVDVRTPGLGEAGPQGDALAIVVVVEAGSGGPSAPLELDHHLVDDRVRRMIGEVPAFGCGCLPGGFADAAGQRERHLIEERQRSRGVAGLQRGLLDRWGGYALAQHGGGFTHEGADHPAGEEAPAVIDDDRRLLDLQGNVDGLGDGLVGGLFAHHDLQQRHLVDGREEVHADEVGRARDPFRQTRDRQGRRVRGQQRSFGHVGLDFGVDLVLEGRVLEHCFDQQISTLGIRRVVRRGDPTEDIIRGLAAHLAPADRLVQQGAAVILALVCSFLRDILEHDLHAGPRGHVGDPRAHHPGAQHHQLLGAVGRVPLRARSALHDVLQVEEERLRHVLRHLTGGEIHEVPGLDPVRGVEIDLRTLDCCGHDVMRGRHRGALDLLAQVRGEGRQHRGELRVAGRAPRDLVTLHIPRLGGLGIGLDPGLGRRQHRVRISSQFVDETDLESSGRFAALPLQEHLHQRLLQPEHAHGASDPAAPRQQTE